MWGYNDEKHQGRFAEVNRSQWWFTTFDICSNSIGKLGNFFEFSPSRTLTVEDLLIASSISGIGLIYHDYCSSVVRRRIFKSFMFPKSVTGSWIILYLDDHCKTHRRISHNSSEQYTPSSLLYYHKTYFCPPIGTFYYNATSSYKRINHLLGYLYLQPSRCCDRWYGLPIAKSSCRINRVLRKSTECLGNPFFLVMLTHVFSWTPGQ